MRVARSWSLGCLSAALAVIVIAAPAHAAQSDNVEAVARLPELTTAIAINFIDDTMFVSTQHGVYSYDVSEPARPRLLGALPMPIWENEDMDVDPVRKRIFVSRDPRLVRPGLATFPYGAVHVIDVSDPALMKQVGFFTLPAGHTSTCINDCDFLWTGGPAAAITDPPDWGGRPIFATDVRNPANPKPCPHPIDTERNFGRTDYTHDVQVDSRGVAWVSGRGGVRGYWTRGEHLNPVSGKVENATACDPVPYAGGGTSRTATPSRFMHNSLREPDETAPLPDDLTHERVLYATEENLTLDCETSGRFVIYDLEGSFAGEGFTKPTQHRMRALDTWTPEAQPGSSGCATSHYFTSRGDGMFVNAFLEQGVRFLDVSDPTDIRQVGYYRQDGGRVWSAHWRGDYVFVADHHRGLEVLRFEGGPSSSTVRAPALAAANAGLKFDRGWFGGLCPLPRQEGAGVE